MEEDTVKYGIKEVVATTYQAISGAGKTFNEWPEMIDNLIPFIGGEEEKSEKEPLRVWGKVENGQIVPATTPVITTQCLRVPVTDGHTAAVFVKFENKPTKEERKAMKADGVKLRDKAAVAAWYAAKAEREAAEAAAAAAAAEEKARLDRLANPTTEDLLKAILEELKKD